MLVPFKDDNPKITENTGFQAGSDSTPMANYRKKHIVLPFAVRTFFTSKNYILSLRYTLGVTPIVFLNIE